MKMSMSMKKFTINAYSFDEAKQAALEEGLTVVKNVTKTYKQENPEDFDAFAQQMLEKHKLVDTTGVGCIVVKEQGSADTKVRPYEFVNNVTTGPLTKKRVFEIRTVDGDVLIGEATSKVEAARIAKQKMKDVKKDLICRQVYRVDDDHLVSFNVKYKPSSKTKLGTYIVFGN